MKKYKIDGVFGIDGSCVLRYGDNSVSMLDGYDARSFVREVGTPIEEPVTYKVGDRFRYFGSDGLRYHIGEECMIVFVRTTGRTQAYYDTLLVRLRNGKPFVLGGRAVKDIERITVSEFDDMCGGLSKYFTKIEDDE